MSDPKNKRCDHTLGDHLSRDYVLHLLDDRVFDIMHTMDGDGMVLATTGCLDANDAIFCGSMVALGDHHMAPSIMPRGRTVDEILRGKAFLAELFGEFELATEASL